MANIDTKLDELLTHINTIKKENENDRIKENLGLLDALLDILTTNKNDPSSFYNILEKYKTKSNTLKLKFFDELQKIMSFDSDTTIQSYLEEDNMDALINYNCNNDVCSNSEKLVEIPSKNIDKVIINNLSLQYDVLQNNIEIFRTYIRSEKENLKNNIKNIQNEEHFAVTLNDDHSEIYKYMYLRNWGIFLSIIGGVFVLNKMK